MTTNLDKAAEAHEYMPELRARRDRWIYRANKEDGESHDRIASRLGLTRQSVANVIHRLETDGDPDELTVPDPPVLSDEAKRRLAAGEAPRGRGSVPHPDETAGPVESEAKQVTSYSKGGKP